MSSPSPQTEQARVYQKMNPVEHIIQRPDTYVGSMRKQESVDFYTADPIEKVFIHNDTVFVVPGLVRVFVEILSNALDNIFRSLEDDVKMSFIKVGIDVGTNEVTVSNDGSWIPLDMHETEGIHIPTMIFGELLTGSNYDDDEDKQRFTSGRNGYGAKLTNIFSHEFSVEIAAPSSQGGIDVFKQQWDGIGLSNRSTPKITHRSTGKPFTKISYTPDLSRFGDGGDTYDEDLLGTYYRLVYDSAMVAGNHKVAVYLDGSKIPVSSLKEYAKLFNDTDEMIEIKTKDSSVVLAASSNGFSSVAFTNGVFNEEGGVHVDDWTNALLKPLLPKFNKKGRPQVSLRDIKPLFRIWVNCTLDKPAFTGQSKTKLASPKPTVKVEKKHISAITKWAVAQRIKDIISSRELLTLKKTEKKKKSFQKIAGYDPANFAGTKKSKDCTLIFTEGLSAKTYAVRGIQKGWNGKKGRDYFGIFPLRGKLLNVRNAKTSNIAGNTEITNAIQAIGLRYGIDYTVDKNFATLNYGRIMILCDADVDGIHIQGLLMNVFHCLFRSLLDRKDPFIMSMQTPIVRVFEGSKAIPFYTEVAFKEYMKDPSKRKLRKKYYKGLGTSSNSEVMESFGEKTVGYKVDDGTDRKMSMVFDNKQSDARKKWLGAYSPPELEVEGPAKSLMSYSDFIDGKMIDFSIDDCGRSIPHLLDGLKESQRKILYAVFLKKLNFKGSTLKVAQLQGFVAEKSGYHHGEQCLGDTITKLANDIVGMNNIPLLFRDGQFGTRLSGGKDASASRYIFTKQDCLTRLLFPPADDALLPRKEDDGDLVEPEFYLPVIPTALVNGCQAGIGTGWSCSLPLYNPLDLVRACHNWMQGGKDDVTEPTPWYRNFKGTIKKISKNKFITSGLLKQEKGKVIINELPVGLWTDKFKEFLEDLQEKKMIKSMKNNCTPQKVYFEIVECPNGMKCTLENLKLTTSLSTANMVMFIGGSKLRKFDTVTEIIDLFCKFRFKLYQKRKKHIIASITRLLNIATNRYAFLQAVMDNKLTISRRREEAIVQDMEKIGLDKMTSKKNVKPNYEYLLSMDMRSFTEEKLAKLQEEIGKHEALLDLTNKTSPEDMWKQDLNTFEAEYRKWEEKMRT